MECRGDHAPGWTLVTKSEPFQAKSFAPQPVILISVRFEIQPKSLNLGCSWPAFLGQTSGRTGTVGRNMLLKTR